MINANRDWVNASPCERRADASAVRRDTGYLLLLGACFLLATSAFAQQKTTATPAKPRAAHPPQADQPAAAADDDKPLPGDWGPSLLYGVLSSPNEEAQYTLLRATFAAGPAVIPELVEALKDDRTAEYAAQ